MSSNRLQSSLLGFCSIVIVTSLLCVDAHQDEVKGAANKGADLAWPWGKPHTFLCPSPFGTFSDPDDCASYFVCVASIASHRTCRRMLLFDKNLGRCVSFLIAVCDNSGKETTTTQEPKIIGTTPDDEKFTCPSLGGTYLHPTDCTKYYTCTFFFPSLKTCPENELFDGVKKQCRPAKEVHCGSRIRPTDSTTLVVTTPEITTPTTTETIVEDTTTPSPPPPPPPTTTTETPTVPSTPTTEAPIPTSTKARVTAPDTHCDKDDLDCIIDDLGEKPDWFVCETDMGSYPHPTSSKLFIFCLNWKPSVKKCGQDLVFSEDLMTCVSP